MSHHAPLIVIIMFLYFQRQRDCIEIVQNNVRIMAAIKDWSWWKLFSKVRPLVQANILEQEKKLKAVGWLLQITHVTAHTYTHTHIIL